MGKTWERIWMPSNRLLRGLSSISALLFGPDGAAVGHSSIGIDSSPHPTVFVERTFSITSQA